MTAIPTEKIKLEIVSSAIEDLSGLYEVIWALNTSYPSLSEVDKIKQSKSAMIELINDDTIKIIGISEMRKS